MNAALILIVTLIILTAGYVLYGKFVTKVFNIDRARKTPAHLQQDHVDFIPVKNWFVLFGHHFCSICGAGPIIGPILAVTYWGWGPSLLWIIFGAILFGAVADFSSLMLSIRHQGKSIATITENIISRRASLFFSWFILLALILVLAVFAVIAAETLTMSPHVVVPSIGLIPTALLVGFLLYRLKIKNLWVTLVGLSILILLLIVGNYFEMTMPSIGGISAEKIWMLILLIYCFVAAVLPVNVLLQPRDYIASYLLFFSIIFCFICILTKHPVMQGDFYHHWMPTRVWPNSGPLFPMLFITIACGAVSGFHSLVSSGTTSKQIDNEAHCHPIGYGSMIMEGVVAVLVVLSVSAGLNYTHFTDLVRQDGPLVALGEGYNNLTTSLLGGYGGFFIILAVNTFILTTLDTATRIAMYLIKELTPIKNNSIAAIIAVMGAALVAFTGGWSLIWPTFGAANQLIAALALLLASMWLINKKGHYIITLIPAVVMLIITFSALGYQLFRAIQTENFVIMVTVGILIIIAAAIITEVLQSHRSLING